MERYKHTADRNQMQLAPMCLDDLIAPDAEVRALELIVERMDIPSLGFTHSTTKQTGCRPYSPVDMFKLYAYSYYKENTNLPALKQQLAETEGAIDNMLNAIQQGILTSSTKKRLDDLEDNKSKLEISILQEEMEKPLLTREQVTFFMQKYRTMDVTKQEERQRMIDTFINAVYVYDDRLVFTFNYKDGTKTVNLDEIKETFGSDLGAGGAPTKKSL